MKPTVSGTVRLSLALVMVGLLWLGVLGGGAVAQAPVLAFTQVGEPAVTDPSTPDSGPHDSAFSPDGSLLAIVNNTSSTLSMFKVGAGGALTRVETIDSEGLFPNSVHFSPSGDLVAVVNIGNATRPGGVSVWQVGTGGTLNARPCSANPAPCFVGEFPSGVTNGTQGEPFWGAFNPDGEWFAVANRNTNTVSLYSVADDGRLTLHSTFATASSGATPGGAGPNAIYFSHDGKLLATGNVGSNSVSTFTFDEATGATGTPRTFATGASFNGAWNIAFSPDDNLLATANADSNSLSMFHVLRNQSGELTGELSLDAGCGKQFADDPRGEPRYNDRGPRGVEFSPGGTLLATADYGLSPYDGTNGGGTASVFSVGPGCTLTEVAGSPFTAGRGSKHTSFTPDGSLFTTVNYQEVPGTVTTFRVTAVEIRKTARSTVAPGGVVRYTVTVTNAGAVEVAGPVIDDLADVLNHARLVGTPTATQGDVKVDLATRKLEWNGTLAPAGESGDSVTIHYAVRVHRSARGLLSDRLTGPPDSTCTSNAGGVLGPECVVETEIVPPRGPVDLAVTKTPSADTVHPGGQLVYTLTVHNFGPANATGVTLEDPAPSGLFLDSAHASQGSCTVTPGELVRCELGGLPAGGSALVLVSATVHLDATGDLVNAASVFGDQGDRNPANNIARARVRVVPLPPPPTPDPGPQPFSDLVITKHVNHASALVGQKLTYTITVVNRGSDAAADVRVTDTSRVPLKVDSITPSRGSCRAGAPFRCELGTVRPGGRVTIKVTATATTAGRQVNAAAVTTSSWQAHARIARAITLVRRPPAPPPPPRVTG